MYELEIYNVAEGWLDYEQYEDKQEAWDSVEYYNKNPRLIVKIHEIPSEEEEEEEVMSYEDYLTKEADMWYDSHDTETGELI